MGKKRVGRLRIRRRVCLQAINNNPNAPQKNMMILMKLMCLQAPLSSYDDSNDETHVSASASLSSQSPLLENPMAPKKQTYNLPLPSQEHSTSSDDSDSQPQQLTQPKPQQAHNSSAHNSSDSSSDKTQPLSREPKKSVKAHGKRPAELDRIDKVSGRKKSKGGDEEGGEIEDNKAGMFARLFTENDEIVLLEGMIDFKEMNNGSLNMVAFHERVKDLLSVSVTKNQIVGKIKRLKKKYKNYLKKGKVIFRPHEFKSKWFELSKKIWESEGLGSEVKGDNKLDMEDWWSLYPLLSASLEAEAVKNENLTGPMSAKEYR